MSDKRGNRTDDSAVAAPTPEWFDFGLFPSPDQKLELNDTEWRERLSENEYRVLRSEGTERPFDNEYFGTKTEGVYVCRSCSNPLFSSVAKYDSGTGWPSFYAPLSPDHVGEKSDHKLLMERVEVHCARCGSHLGHVFDDGPAPTGLRYCMNSTTLRLIDEPAHAHIAAGREDELLFTLNR
ncbi:peptide-methionine (R)-S-oxide reductase MsrB [Balneolales bacterium ANBcel1]|nr:peptide-methionine (R)-S-oxide reductase MsrB [Balneolales bacterium ANBcel1]